MWNYSRLPLNGHLYKTDTSVNGHLELVPAFLYSLYLTLHKTDTSLRRTLSAGPKEIMDSRRQLSKGETWSRGTNSRLPFDVNVMLNLSIVFFSFSREWWDHWQSTLQSDKTPQSWENESSRNSLRSGLCWTHTAVLWGNRFWRRIWNRIRDVARLRVVPHFSSGIRERAKRERAWKSPHARKGDMRRGVIFTRARVSLALLSLRRNGGLLVVYDVAWTCSSFIDPTPSSRRVFLCFLLIICNILFVVELHACYN